MGFFGWLRQRRQIKESNTRVAATLDRERTETIEELNQVSKGAQRAAGRREQAADAVQDATMAARNAIRIVINKVQELNHGTSR